MVYDASSIRHVSGLSAIRLLPTQYVPDQGLYGLTHCALEILHNSIDETSLMNGDGIITIVVFQDSEQESYQLLIRDNGRGIPHEKELPLKSFTEINTSGKYDSKAYQWSAGTYGVGAKAAAGLSKDFIALTQREGKISKVLISEGVVKKVEYGSPDPTNGRGVTVLYSPDFTIMRDVELFIDKGFPDILTLCRKFSIFGNTRFIIKSSDTPIPSSLWKQPSEKCLAAINKLIDKAYLEYDSADKNSTTDSFLHTLWGLSRSFVWSTRLSSPIHAASVTTYNKRDKVEVQEEVIYGYQIISYYAKFVSEGNVMGLVNNVPIDHGGSAHVRVLNEVYRDVLSEKIEVPQIKEFFLSQYKLPLFHAIGVNRSGAKFAGTTKHAYYDKVFEELYRIDLSKKLRSVEQSEAINLLFELIYPDIEAKYRATMSAPISDKSSGMLFMRLVHKKAFVDCEATDRSNTELFIVEGESAGGRDGIDSLYQGIYRIRGKPRNSYRTLDQMNISAETVRANGIYRDIFTVMNINPAKPDFSKLNFSKLILMADADSHGYHIDSLLVGNLYAGCPELVNGGYVYIMVPPLYEVKLTGSQPIYVRDADSLIEWRSRYLYRPTIEISLYPTSKKARMVPGTVMEEGAYIYFAELVNQAGAALAQAAKSFAIDIRVVEFLTLVAANLKPDQDFNDLEDIPNIFTGAKFTVNKQTNSLKLSTVDRDIFISAIGLKDYLLKNVVPYMDRLLWQDVRYHVTTKQTDSFRNKPMMISEIYSLFEALGGYFSTSRFKGIGSMPKETTADICYNPEKRQLIKVTSIGDINRVCELLGKDPTYRKQYLQSGSISDIEI